MDLKQTFVVAVSGGVDSVVLLHKIFMNKTENVNYIVAHFDHGIRSDSYKDVQLVRKLTYDYGFMFELGIEALGAGASEAAARESRYRFLREVAKKHNAEKIITAHHQDDLLETMILNLLRGTGPRGLNPMQGQLDILRPLINTKKQELIEYAKANSLLWREDSTNTDDTYMRNYIRQHCIPKLKNHRLELLNLQQSIAELYTEIDERITLLLPKQNVLHRATFVVLPWNIQKELMRAWLIRSGIKEIDKQLIERVVLAVKTLPIHKKIDINGSLWLLSESENVLLTSK